MRMWEIRENSDRYDLGHRSGMREKSKEEAYECGFKEGYEEGYEDAMEEIEKSKSSHRRSSSYRRY